MEGKEAWVSCKCIEEVMLLQEHELVWGLRSLKTGKSGIMKSFGCVL